MEFPWGSSSEGSDSFFAYYVKQQLSERKNLASEIELLEQARVVYRSYTVADNGDGELNFYELKRLCDNLGLPLENDEEEAMAKKDKDESGTIDVDELMSWWLLRVGSLPNPAKQQEAIARNTFRKLDKDHGGTLDVSELATLFEQLGANFSEREMLSVMQQLDSSGDETVDETEFIEWWTDRSINNRRGGGLLAMKLRQLASKAQQLFSTDVFTAAWQGDLELIKLFIEAEPRNSFAQDTTEFGDGWTPLHYAAYRGHVEIVSLLLESSSTKASFANKQNDKGFTALFYASQMMHPEICKLLLDAGADPAISGTSDEFAVPVSLCPADLTADFPYLNDILRSHTKCNSPEVVPADKVEATLSENGTLTIDFVVKTAGSFMKSISSLPIRKWHIELECINSSIQPHGLIINQLFHDEKQSSMSVSSPVDKKWLRSALRDHDVQFGMRICAVNSLRDEGPMTDLITVAFSARRLKQASIVDVGVVVEAEEDEEDVQDVPAEADTDETSHNEEKSE